jgi:ADP-glucose pyrophosphorylase
MHSLEAMTNMLESLICESSQAITKCLLKKSIFDGNTPVKDPQTVAYAIIMQHLHIRVNMHAGMKPKAWLAQRQLKEDDDDVTGDSVAKVCFSDEIAEKVYDNWMKEAMKNDMKDFK